MNESRVRKPIRLFVFLLMLVLLILAIQPALASGVAGAQAVRFATFNASLNRSFEGQLIADLSTPDNAQAKTIAEIVQRTRPAILLINEFDFDADGTAAALFQQNYLSVSQNGAQPISYNYHFVAPSNTGIGLGMDLDRDNNPAGPGDAHGFGFFPGQYGMLVLSKLPIIEAEIRTFKNFLWRDMPGALLPDDAESYDIVSATSLAEGRRIEGVTLTRTKNGMLVNSIKCREMTVFVDPEGDTVELRLKDGEISNPARPLERIPIGPDGHSVFIKGTGAKEWLRREADRVALDPKGQVTWP